VLGRRNVHLALLDVMMPVMDGIELTRRIKADPRWKSLPVILLTARGELSDKAEGFRALADDYVVKPFEIEDVTARIKVQLRISRLESRKQSLSQHHSRMAMVGAAAHELAQPLAGATGYLQLLQNSLERRRLSDGEIQQRLERISGCLLKTRGLADKMAALEAVEMEDYACGLHIVNIHARKGESAGGAGQKADGDPASGLPPAGAAAGGGERILLVDELLAGDQQLQLDLRRQGFEVAVEADLAGGPLPLLVLLLVRDSSEQVRGVLERIPLGAQELRPPVLALLPTPARPDDRHPGLELLRVGVDDVLVRPFQMEELLLRIRSRIKLHLLRLDELEFRRLGAAVEVCARALEELVPQLAACERTMAELRAPDSELPEGLQRLAGDLEGLTRTVRRLQSREIEGLGREP